jgi:hemoglobin
MNEPVPTLYEWVGGQSALERLTTHFYAAVREDELLGPVFAHMHGEHPQYVAAFIGEVFGGPIRTRLRRAGIRTWSRSI